MLSPYIFTALFYLFVALFIAADAALISWNLSSAFPALRWMRVHFITLGFVAQVMFGLLPVLVAGLVGKARPVIRWDIWLLLNAGFVLLIGGFSGVARLLIFTGGTLVFVAVILLFAQLWRLGGGNVPVSLRFYLTGVAYLLLGIIVGTGLWLNWDAVLHIRTPLEVHIHANSWGFMSLVFAGLLIDFMPMLTGRPLGGQRQQTAIYWGMTIGALGLVLGPWLPAAISLPPTVVGLVLHLTSTLWLVGLMGRGLKGGGYLRQAGGWHLLASYLWILLPVLVAPLIILNFLEGGPVEMTAPQPLIYGWVLQFALAIIPYVTGRYLLHEPNPALGGSWATLILLTLGGLLVWVSIFVPAGGLLYGLGFTLYALSFIHPIQQLLAIVRQATS